MFDRPVFFKKFACVHYTMCIRILSFIIGILFTLPAQSLDFSVDSGWEGFYRGLHAGTAIGSVKTRSGANRATYDLDDGDKSTGGILFGWNGQKGKFVYGLEGGVSIHEIKGDFSGGGILPHQSDYVWNAELRARLGLDMGRFMPFIAGGPILGEFYQAFDNTRNGDIELVTGLTAGAGVDVKVFRNVLLRAEYLYQYLGQQDYFVAALNTTLTTSSDVHMLRLGVLTRFGDPLDDQLPRMEDVPRFAGSSFGIHAGYATGDVELSNFATGNVDINTMNIGLTAGYLFDFGDWRLGAESDITFHAGNNKGRPNAPVTSIDHRMIWTAALRGKVGYNFNDSFMPYLMAGANLGQVSNKIQPNNVSNIDPYKNGYSAGAGLEYALSDKISMDLSYSWNYYPDNSIRIPPNSDLDTDTTFHHIRIGFKFR